MIGIEKPRQYVYEKTGLDINYFVKNGFWLFARQIILTLTALTLVVFFTKSLSQEMFGQYQYVLSFLGIISFLALPGINTSIIKYVSVNSENSYKKANLLSLKTAMFSIPILLIISLFYTSQKNMQISLILAGIFFPLIYGINKWDSFYQSKEEFKKGSILAMIQGITTTFAIICAIYFTKNLIFILLSYFITASIFNIIYTKKTFNQVKIHKNDEIIKYGKFLTKANLIPLLIGQVDKILVGIILGFNELAIYAVATEIGKSFKELSKIMYKIALPNISKTKNIKKTINKKRILIMLIVAVAFTIISIILLPYIIHLIFGEEYNASISLAQLFIIAFPLWMINSIFISAVEIEKSKRTIIKIRIFPYLSRLMLIILFIFRSELYVIIIGDIIFSVVTAIISGSFVIKHINNRKIYNTSS